LNFTHGKKLVAAGDWKNRKKGQPFFVQATFAGTHRTWKRDSQRPINGKDVEIPPYYPDTALVRRDWANGLEQAQIIDREVSVLLKRLEAEGLAENTIVFFIGDHGRCHIRGKQFLYEGGIKIPLIVRWPKKIAAKQVREEHVSAIDISKTILDLAGVKVNHVTHGMNLFSNEIKERQFTFAARGKMDDTHDAMRAIVGKLSDGKSYKLIYNLMPERPYCQFNWYKERSYPVLTLMNIMKAKGQLNEAQSHFLKARKPDFELYCLSDDPHEIKNLWKKASHTKQFDTLKKNLDNWRKEIKDTGVSKQFRTGGHPPKYPTASLKDYEARLILWKKWVFRKPNEKLKHPFSRGPGREKILKNFQNK
jgi:N-sulfoglucosamine sulfohydrolase